MSRSSQLKRVGLFYGIGMLLSLSKFNKIVYVYHTTIMVSVILSPILRVLLSSSNICIQQLASYLATVLVIFVMIYALWILIVLVLSGAILRAKESKYIVSPGTFLGILFGIIVCVIAIIVLPISTPFFSHILERVIPFIRENLYLIETYVFIIVASNIASLLAVFLAEIEEQTKTRHFDRPGVWYLCLQIFMAFLVLFPVLSLISISGMMVLTVVLFCYEVLPRIKQRRR